MNLAAWSLAGLGAFLLYPGLRRLDVMEVDHLLLDLSRDVRHDVLVEEAVVLLLVSQISATQKPWA
jgi:hypothetical protein